MSTLTTALTATTEHRFLARFERIWEALRRYQVQQGLGWSILTATLGLGGLALADYRLELSLAARGIGLNVVAAVMLVVFWRAVIVPLRWWTRPRTAAEIEGRFPELGQRIRTLVQYGSLPDERIHSEGVMPSLVAALSEETRSRAEPLPLDVILPRWRVRAIALLALIPILAIVAGAVLDPEWRIALERAPLGDRPYTTIAVAPGDVTVDQGARLPITVDLKGRLRRSVVLQTRPAGTPAAAWKSIALEPLQDGPARRRRATLEKIRDPLVYRVVAGPATSGTALIDVRYPLAVKLFEVVLTPPAYTGLEPTTERGGNLHVVERTDATFRIDLNAPVREASLVVTDPNPDPKHKDAATAQVIRLALAPGGQALTAHLSLTRNLNYQIVARTSDGRTLPKNSYRIDVRADRAPRVAFEEPAEALEVHPIAEVLNRVTVSDDFGLARAGIVYRVNDGEEKTLLARDFAPSASASKTKPERTARLEDTLALEALALSPTDSVTYYAFAEDNFPGGSRRTETDLRYIDIRPFKRQYLLADPNADTPSDVSQALEELIARQRFNLNRTVRLAKHRPGDRTTPEDPLKIASFEELLASLTRELAEALQTTFPDRFEAVQQAEASMLAAVNALDHEKNDQAAPLEAEALRHLIEARRKLQVIIGQGGGAAMISALRAYDRTQAQKLLKPKSEADEAAALVVELEKLAGDEDFVYAMIKALLEAGGSGRQPGGTGEPATPDVKGENPAKEQQDARGEPGTETTAGTSDGPAPGDGTTASTQPSMKGKNGQARNQERGKAQEQQGQGDAKDGDKGMAKNQERGKAQEQQGQGDAKDGDKGMAKNQEQGKAQEQQGQGDAKDDEKGIAKNQERGKAQEQQGQGDAKDDEKGIAKNQERGKAQEQQGQGDAKDDEKGIAKNQERGKAQEQQGQGDAKDDEKGIAKNQERGKAQEQQGQGDAKDDEKGIAKNQKRGKAQEQQGQGDAKDGDKGMAKNQARGKAQDQQGQGDAKDGDKGMAKNQARGKAQDEGQDDEKGSGDRMADRGATGAQQKADTGDEPSATDERGGKRVKMMDRRAIAEKQEKIADAARALEERLKRLEPASELSKLRLAKAAEAAQAHLGCHEPGPHEGGG